MHHVDHISCRKEEKRLDKGMCCQVEHGSIERAYAAGQEHVSHWLTVE